MPTRVHRERHKHFSSHWGAPPLIKQSCVGQRDRFTKKRRQSMPNCGNNLLLPADSDDSPNTNETSSTRCLYRTKGVSAQRLVHVPSDPWTRRRTDVKNDGSGDLTGENTTQRQRKSERGDRLKERRTHLFHFPEMYRGSAQSE